MSSFQAFLSAHPIYAEVYRELAALDRKLAMAAVTVHAVHGDELSRVADPLLAYAMARYGPTLVPRYVERVKRLEEMQRRFDRDPRAENLGDPGVPVDRDQYHIALLLSIVFTNHRFEILQRLDRFFVSLPSIGRLAALGSGTGYEIQRASALLAEWEIESYDIDPEAEAEGRRILCHFDVQRSVLFARELPLDAPETAHLAAYDAIVACEVLEHLPDPARALCVMRDYLTAAGRMFVTMAVNIAQEDHVFLYPDTDACRHQLRECALRVVEEWIAPQSAWPPGPRREADFRKGNYVAVVEKG